MVKSWMRKAVITVDAGESLQDAVTRMKEYFVPMLPVLKSGELVGVVTDLDLKRASASVAANPDMYERIDQVAKLKVSDIMTGDPVTVPPDFTLEETAETLLKYNISGAPVVDHRGRLLGIISQREIYKALLSMVGNEKCGLHFGFQVADRPGSIKEVTDIIRHYGGRVVSILTSYEQAPEGTRFLYIRAFKVDPDKKSDLIHDLREKRVLRYIVDRDANTREEFPPPPTDAASHARH